MALTYRALLIPTAALDSSGNAKPNAVFSVTPMAGGSPVAVYGAAQGGSALAADQIKTDALGNISGLYVAEPGPYTLSFAGGGTVVTSAVMDSRDVATSGDLADALVGADGPVFTEVPVQNWFPYVASSLAPTNVGSTIVNVADSIDPELTNPENGWLTGPDIRVDPDTGLVEVVTAGLYLLQVDSSESTYLNATGTSPVSVAPDNIEWFSYNQATLSILSPTGWGTNLTNTFRVCELNGEVKIGHTLYLPAGTTIALALRTVGQQIGSQPFLTWRVANLSISLTRFAPAT